MSILEETRDLLAELIAFPTVSSDSNLALIDHLALRLESLGAHVEIWFDETGKKANLFATLGPMQNDGIVLSGHSDVVPVADQVWASDPFDLVERDGRWYGRGACDMKGFIAAAVAMASEYAQLELKRPVHFAFTYDEEVGCFGARALVETLRNKGLRPAVAIIGEPTSMRIIEGHKGCYEYSTHFTGLEGHGSTPDRGVNAVEYAVRYVGKLLELKADLVGRAPLDSPFDPPWTTVSTGRVSGGVAHNVIPGRAQVDWEMRPVQSSDAKYVKDALGRFCGDALLPQMRAVHPDADIVTEVIGEVEGLQPMPENKARELVSELTGSNRADVVPFGTEAGIFHDLEMDVVVCGPGSIDQAHKPDEFVSIKQMEKCLEMLKKLGAKLT